MRKATRNGLFCNQKRFTIVTIYAKKDQKRQGRVRGGRKIKKRSNLIDCMYYLGMYFCPKPSLFWVRNLHHSTVYVVICCSRTHIADGRCAYNSFRVQRVQAKEGRSFCHLHFYCVAAQWGRLLVKEFGTECQCTQNYVTYVLCDVRASAIAMNIRNLLLILHVPNSPILECCSRKLSL